MKLSILFLSSAVFLSTNVFASPVLDSTFKYKYTQSTGTFGCGDHHRFQAKVEKKPDGSLANVNLKISEANGCFPFWSTQFELTCEN